MMTTEAKALAAAAYNNANDEDGWTYHVIRAGKYFIIEVRDENGVGLGLLPV